jgi:hypothetical protein
VGGPAFRDGLAGLARSRSRSIEFDPSKRRELSAMREDAASAMCEERTKVTLGEFDPSRW